MSSSALRGSLVESRRTGINTAIVGWAPIMLSLSKLLVLLPQPVVATNGPHVVDRLLHIISKIGRQSACQRHHKLFAKAHVSLDIRRALEELKREQVIKFIDTFNQREIVAELLNAPVKLCEVLLIILAFTIDRRQTDSTRQPLAESSFEQISLRQPRHLKHIVQKSHGNDFCRRLLE